MSKHTPGPWWCWEECHGEPKGSRQCTIQSAEHQIASGYSYLVDGDTAIANARLMAAAPELLAALRDLLIMAENEFRYDDVRLENARTALARAEGVAP